MSSTTDEQAPFLSPGPVDTTAAYDGGRLRRHSDKADCTAAVAVASSASSASSSDDDDDNHSGHLPKLPSRHASMSPVEISGDPSRRVAHALRRQYYIDDVHALCGDREPVCDFYRRQNALLNKLAAVPPAHFYWTNEAPGHQKEIVGTVAAGSGIDGGNGMGGLLLDEESHPLLLRPAHDANESAEQQPQQSRYRCRQQTSEMDASLSAASSAAADEMRARRAILASNVANVVLLVGQVYAFVATRSLALLANTVDSILDFVSGVIVAGTWYVRRKGGDVHTRYCYPIGRTRLESVGVIVLAVIMTAATLNVFTESLSALTAAAAAQTTMKHHRMSDSSSLSSSLQEAGVMLTPTVLGVIGFALATKLSLWLLCRNSPHDAVAALAVDHANDVISNCGALIAAFVSRYWAPLDPLGGILISLFILRNWWSVTAAHLDHLISRSASSELYTVCTFCALHHDSRVRAIDRVTLYHVGPSCFAEVDIVLDPQMRLEECHDIGESLQVRIESVEGIERCFVHLDYETSHVSEKEHRHPV